jgi:hypothetical protein
VPERLPPSMARYRVTYELIQGGFGNLAFTEVVEGLDTEVALWYNEFKNKEANKNRRFTSVEKLEPMPERRGLLG